MISREFLSELGYGKVTYLGDVIELYEMQCLPFKCEVMVESGRNDGKNIITSQSYHIAIEVLAHKNLKEWSKFKNVFGIIDWSEEPEQIFKKAEELRNELNKKGK